jgi:hypothetical protein
LSVTPLETITVGVIVERTKGMNQWTDFLWRPIDVLPGAPQTPAWTQLSGDEARAQFYAGAATIELYRTETPNYRENLTSGEPKLWVVLRPSSGEPPLELMMVTADPAEGEAMTEAGNDIVQPVAMPETVRAAIEAFIAGNPYERVHIKRKRERADPESLARRLVPREEGK